MAELTETHKTAIRESWKIISKNLKQNAVSLYVDYLFPKYPTTRAMFKNLEGISDTELATHPKMRAHGVRVLYTISSMVDNLDDLEVVVDQVDKTVRDHIRYEVTYEQYQALLADVIPSWLKDKVGDAWSDTCGESWTALVKVVLSCVKDTLDLWTDTSPKSPELTDTHKAAIRTSWDVIRKDLKQNAVSLFVDFLFPKYPATRAMFKNFEGISDTELATHPKMRAHGVRVLYTISSMVDNLDDLEVVVDHVDKTVRDHMRYDVAYAHYEALLADVIPAWLEKKLGDTWDKTTTESWTILVTIMLSCIKNTLELWTGAESEKK